MLRRAAAWFRDQEVSIQRVFSDNGAAFRSHAWRKTCSELGIKPKHSPACRPQTNNGKIERFHRTLAEAWAYAKFYGAETERRQTLPGWIHFYNRHRRHTAIKAAPISRLKNLPGHHV